MGGRVEREEHAQERAAQIVADARDKVDQARADLACAVEEAITDVLTAKSLGAQFVNPVMISRRFMNN